jgi:glutathione synthase/RimK-type ligase-like ATP-grasp enzyme
VNPLSDTDLERLDQIRWCPVQFQQFVEGINVRVHVINTAVFSTLINSDATDYRYAHRINKGAELQEIGLPEELSKRCVNLSQALGLEFSGIDLMITADNEVFCFEVNPSPAFSYFEANTGQPIAHTVACHLAGLQ